MISVLLSLSLVGILLTLLAWRFGFRFNNRVEKRQKGFYSELLIGQLTFWMFFYFLIFLVYVLS